MARLSGDTDAEQLRQLRAKPRWAAIARCGVSEAALADETNASTAVFRNLQMSLFLKHIGGLPDLTALLQPWAQLALLPRERILSQLCALALACRPGALRCCIDKTVRQRLQLALGPAFAPLATLSRDGRPVAEELVRRTPAEWACVGFEDWRHSLVPGQPVLHRLVALSLPAAEFVATAAAVASEAELSAPEALRRLAGQGLAWPS